jgi:hypothetical protein
MAMAQVIALFEDPAFAPEDVELLSRVFEHAWAQLVPEFGEGAVGARAELARGIIDLAKSGQRDPERLALYGLSRVRRTSCRSALEGGDARAPATGFA